MKLSLQLEAIIIFSWDIQKLKSFYAVLLGMKLVDATDNNWIVMEGGHCQLCLHKIGPDYQAENIQKGNDPKNTKLVFFINDDIRTVRDYLISHDIKMKDVMTWDGYGYWICDGEDPEGNVFQLKQAKDVN